MAEHDFNLLLERLDKILFWLKFAHLEEGKQYFSDILNTPRKKEIYELTDGKNSIATINEKLGIKSKSMVLEFWADWTEKGILVESPEVKGRKMKIMELRELGL